MGLMRTANAAAVMCPVGQPGAPMSRGEIDFMSTLDSHLTSVRNGTCRTADGLDCDLVNWSSLQAARYPGCAAFFFDVKGNEGPLGKLITGNVRKDIEMHEARGETSPFLRDYPDLEDPKVCPGFKTMTPSQKTFFWSWFFEILGFFESHCDPTQVNRSRAVPNPPAVGLYQMEERPSLRNWRGPNCRISSQAIHTAEGNTACALEIMRDSMNNKNQVFGGPNGRSYWYALNQNNDTHEEMKKYLGRFPLCKPEGGASPEEEDSPIPVRHSRSRSRASGRSRSTRRPAGHRPPVGRPRIN